MGRYFSFDRMITPTFVKVFIFSASSQSRCRRCVGSLGRNAIKRCDHLQVVRLALRRFGVGLVVVGNIVWRVFCELWVVLFGIHSELVSVRDGLSFQRISALYLKSRSREK